MASDLERIVFPVIAVKDGEAVEPAADEWQLRSCSRDALDEEYHRGLQIFDARGQRFVVQAAKPLDGLPDVPARGRKPRDRYGPHFVSLDMDGPFAIQFSELRAIIASHEVMQNYAHDVLATGSFDELYGLIDSLYPNSI